ncbi:DUF6226 family protein [Agrococcus baldri]|uniref:Uncharacterized protein n=1 Tax=Agrococcus baldri TaxID=153730 RepID=A0AA87URD7_9MICO|nr:DUF6226 family protein [Agrococcus baldri]GEK79469.1 hypothetical protein ABA31_08200 [Agrococcus baldri]
MAELPVFRMPSLPTSWVDAEGVEIPFGQRWGLAAPPDEAYERITCPERYQPLHDVADALLAHLLDEYECVAEEVPAAAHELRAVRLLATGRSHGIGIAWTDFPGVRADLGGEVDAAAPICGCDACDESLEQAAEQLSDSVLRAVAPGDADWPLRAR